MHSLILLSTLATTCLAATFTVQVGPGLTYTPSALTISQGDTVNFNFQSSDHDVVQGANCSPTRPSLFNLVQTGQVTFNQTGTFPYFCSVGNHCAGGMVGTITVQAAGASTPPSSNSTTTPKASNGETVRAGLGVVVPLIAYYNL